VLAKKSSGKTLKPRRGGYSAARRGTITEKAYRERLYGRAGGSSKNRRFEKLVSNLGHAHRGNGGGGGEK